MPLAGPHALSVELEAPLAVGRHGVLELRARDGQGAQDLGHGDPPRGVHGQAHFAGPVAQEPRELLAAPDVVLRTHAKGRIHERSVRLVVYREK